MAQANFTPVSLYYSTNVAAVPSAANLTYGELAINITSGTLYFKDSNNTVQVLASKTAANGVTSISFGSTGLTPSTASNGVVTVAGTLAINNGGTGLSTIGANGTVLTSNGTAASWQTAAAGGVSTGKAIAMSLIFGF
jgi:hypothetical protein